MGINPQIVDNFMFIGEYKYILDDKGRLAIPTKFRSKFLRGAVVTKGLDNCLFVYTKEEWEKEAAKFATLPKSQANSRAYARFTLAGAMDCEIDKQGRVMLPEYLRKYADLKRNVVVAGLYNRLEIWNEEKWEQYKSETERTSVHIAEELGGLGI